MNLPPLGSLVEYDGKAGVVQAIEVGSGSFGYRIVSMDDPAVTFDPAAGLGWDSVTLLCGPVLVRGIDGPGGTPYSRTPMGAPAVNGPLRIVSAPTSGNHLMLSSHCRIVGVGATAERGLTDASPSVGAVLLSNNGFLMLGHKRQPEGHAPGGTAVWTAINGVRGSTSGSVSPNTMRRINCDPVRVSYLTDRWTP